jgi:hypothetical protein
MKILITERQLRYLVENADLNNAFKNLKLNDILYLRKVYKPNDEFDHKFKVVEDMGESWKLVSLDGGSTNTGFDWYVEKDESLKDSQVVLVKSNKKTKEKQRVTLTNIISAKLGDDILSISKTGEQVTTDDVKSTYDTAIAKIEQSESDMADEAKHDAAIAIVKQEFGNIPEVEIIDDAGYGRVNRGGKSGDLDAEDAKFMDVSDLDGLVEAIKKNFKDGEGVRFTLRDGDSVSVINFNVLSVSGNTAEIKLIETDDSEYSKYRKGRFIMTFNRSSIDVNDDNTFNITLSIADTGGDIEIKNISRIDATSKNSDEVKLDKEKLLKYIQSDPVLMGAFAKTPTLMGLINIGDVRGLSKAYEILNRAGFGLDGSKSKDIKSGNFSDKFSSNFSAKIRLLKDVTFSTGNSIEAGEKIVNVKKSKNTVILSDNERNTYKILKDLGADIYEVNAQRKQDTSGIRVNIKVLDYKTQN